MARRPAANGETKSQPQMSTEARLFEAADKLRKNLEPSDYKHVVLGLIFLKHISDSFEALHAKLAAEDAKTAEDKDEYLGKLVFWVPKRARWTPLGRASESPPAQTRRCVRNGLGACRPLHTRTRGSARRRSGRSPGAYPLFRHRSWHIRVDCELVVPPSPHHRSDGRVLRGPAAVWAVKPT